MQCVEECVPTKYQTQDGSFVRALFCVDNTTSEKVEKVMEQRHREQSDFSSSVMAAFTTADQLFVQGMRSPKK